MMFQTKTISYQIQNKPILMNIDLSFSENSLTAIMGLNGAGKSTLLKLLSGYLKPTQGEVFLNNNTIHSIATKELAKQIAFVPQDFPTEFPYTVFDFVMMARFPWQSQFFGSTKDYEIVKQALKTLDLDRYAKRIISSLSGGERQRVLIARALAQETPIILLDEPVNHLDIKNRIFILDLLKRENQIHKKTIIAVMHDFVDVQNYFDQVVLLKNGQLKYTGSKENGFEKKRLQDVFDIDVWQHCLKSESNQKNVISGFCGFANDF